jgi:hypothetical protein
MGKEFGKDFRESASAILPMILVILIINFSLPGLRLKGPVLVSLLVSIVPLLLGTALFSIGAGKSIAKIGEIVGTTLTKRKSIVLLLFVAGLMGFLATMAEPDLSVLASRISKDGPSWSLIAVAAAGVGLFLIVAILRVVYNKPLKYWLAIGYGLVFTLGLFADKSFFTISFDSGGMTTGVVTVPFIISLGVGVASVMGGENAEDDSFGYSGLCSLGTVLACMVFTIALRNSGVVKIQGILSEKFSLTGDPSLHDTILTTLGSYSDMGSLYLANFIGSLKDVAISMTPIVAFFFILNIYAKMRGKNLGSVIVGFVYTFLGLVLFFLGAESGFMPFSLKLGEYFGGLGKDKTWVFLLIGFLTGAISMLAEPSVKVLADNVSEVSRGAIPSSVIYLALCISIGLAITFNVLRVTYDIPFLYFIVPLFLIAVTLAFFSPEIYCGIAIDAAGVATGTMAGCFFMPMFIGYTAVLYGSDYGRYGSYGEAIMNNGFGVIGIMSVMPIIAVEIVGISVVINEKNAYRKALEKALEPEDDQIIHLPYKTEELPL